jgi:hypothetical protein
VVRSTRTTRRRSLDRELPEPVEGWDVHPRTLASTADGLYVISVLVLFIVFALGATYIPGERTAPPS